MKIVKASELGEAAINKLLQKPAFDEVELSPKIRRPIRQLLVRI